MATSLPDVLDGRPVAMVTTMVGRQLSARPVTVAELAADRITFLAHRDAEWVKHVEGREAIVHLTFADEARGNYVSLAGTASTSHDPARIRGLWRADVHGAFFTADDPDAVVIEFAPTEGEWWSDADRQGAPVEVRSAGLSAPSRATE